MGDDECSRIIHCSHSQVLYTVSPFFARKECKRISVQEPNNKNYYTIVKSIKTNAKQYVGIYDFSPAIHLC